MVSHFMFEGRVPWSFLWIFERPQDMLLLKKPGFQAKFGARTAPGSLSLALERLRLRSLGASRVSRVATSCWRSLAALAWSPVAIAATSRSSDETARWHPWPTRTRGDWSRTSHGGRYGV